MTRPLTVLACCAFLLAVGLMACGGTDIEPKGVDEPCTRTSECIEGLACLAGVCIEQEGSEDS